MACFLVPAAEAVITTGICRHLEHKERMHLRSGTSKMKIPAAEIHLPASSKLKWLNTMLWGGSGLLMFEHIWHGEISAAFPFLTAASTAEGTAEMLYEMSTTGVAMAVLVTAAWGVIAAAASLHEKRLAAIKEEEETYAV